jgi:hypothetical protein
MREEINPGVPELRLVSPGLRLMLGLMTAVGAVTGKGTAMIDKLALGGPLKWLAAGYRMYTAAN